MNIDTPDTYFVRCTEALGQEAHNLVAVVRWCYDHPPRKALPKPGGTRDWHFYTERRIGQCLHSVAGNGSVDGLATAILRQWIQDCVPELWSMYERHAQEIEARMAELRQNEPELHKEEPPFDQIPR